ncbi:MAG: prepilin-type N-terminal cleavage/methylation domain-containing protein [Colwellia sp.]
MQNKRPHYYSGNVGLTSVDQNLIARRMNSPLHHFSKRGKGFTLIEIIIGIVVLSISLAVISTLIVPTEQKSADQIHQVKAAELGQSLLNDISSRAFDENSEMAGGRLRCGEPKPNGGSNNCTDKDDFGPEDGNDGRPNFGETNRSLFNDVDDFHRFSARLNANNQGLHSGYDNFIVDVKVIYDGDSLNLAKNELAKRITVTITTPLGTDIEFATYKTNY